MSPEPQLEPVKRRGNRRYYQRQDVVLIRQIRGLLYEDGYTIGGARSHLTGEGTQKDTSQTKIEIQQIKAELEEILEILK